MKHIKGSLLVIFVMYLAAPAHLCGQTLMSVLKQTKQVSSFSQAIIDTGLDKKLNEPGPFTIFAPTNQAFDKEISGKNYSASRMKSFLLNHIMTGWATEKSMKSMSRATSLGGITLEFKSANESVLINEAQLVQKNIKTENGVIHIINKVLK